MSITISRMPITRTRRPAEACITTKRSGTHILTGQIYTTGMGMKMNIKRTTKAQKYKNEKISRIFYGSMIIEGFQSPMCHV